MSYVPEFQGDHERDSDIVVTVDGLSGAGKGTLAEQIADILDVPAYSAGDFFRELAAERNMTVQELSEKAGKDVDLEVDRRTLRKGLNESCVIESRIASRVLGDHSDLRIRLKADMDERARRVMERDGRESLDQVREEIERRDRNNWERYGEYYGIEDGLDIYHLVLDNTGLGLEEQRSIFETLLEGWFEL